MWCYLSSIFRSRQVRFYVFSLGDDAGRLAVRSRTLHSGATDSVLWLSEIPQSYSWQRAEATFSSSDNSKVREEQDKSKYHRIYGACNTSGQFYDRQHMQRRRLRRFEFKFIQRLLANNGAERRGKVKGYNVGDLFLSTQIVFRYEIDHGHRGLMALDDISFSRECIFDPHNSNLPDTSPTSTPATTTTGPCQVNQKCMKEKSRSNK